MTTRPTPTAQPGGPDGERRLAPRPPDIPSGCLPMSKLASAVRNFVRDENGASMAEYALLIAVIALVAVAGAKTLGANINTKLGNAATTIANP